MSGGYVVRKAELPCLLSSSSSSELRQMTTGEAVCSPWERKGLGGEEEEGEG